MTNPADAEPRFSMPWDGYNTYGKIKLSDGGKYVLSDIKKVLEKVKKGVLEGF